ESDSDDEPVQDLHFAPNSHSNCFHNVAMAAMLAAFDGQPLPERSSCTPSASVFYDAIGAVRDSMYCGTALPPSILATLAAARNTVMTNAGLPGSGCAMGDAASVFESLCQRQRDFFPVSSWPATLEGRRALVASTRKTLGMDWRGRVTCPTDDHALREVCPLQSAAMRDPTVFTIPHG
ncbi:unnamed protein product, partial [Pylaiella littoralis]